MSLWKKFVDLLSGNPIEIPGALNPLTRAPAHKRVLRFIQPAITLIFKFWQFLAGLFIGAILDVVVEDIYSRFYWPW